MQVCRSLSKTAALDSRPAIRRFSCAFTSPSLSNPRANRTSKAQSPSEGAALLPAPLIERPTTESCSLQQLLQWQARQKEQINSAGDALQILDNGPSSSQLSVSVPSLLRQVPPPPPLPHSFNVLLHPGQHLAGQNVMHGA